MGTNGNKTNKFTLCWDCRRAVEDQCSWADNGTPVDGWNAHQTRLKLWQLNGSYHVNGCPLFERDSMRGGQLPLAGEKSDGLGNSSQSGADGNVNRMAESGSNRLVGNKTRDVVSGGGRKARSVDRDVLALAYGVLERAVLDWDLLERGKVAEVFVDDTFIKRSEMLEFFFSDWFKKLCDITEYTPEQFRSFIGISDDDVCKIGIQEKRRFAL